jgi:hypothetical protein
MLWFNEGAFFMGKPKVATFLGIGIILIGAIVGVMVIGRETAFLPRARPEFIPQQVKLTNISDTGFSVSWVTQVPSVGFIKIGESSAKLETTITDDRDQLTGNSGEFITHHISVQGLQPSTQYFFKLGSQGKQLYDNEGQAFSITTAPSLAALNPVDVASGTVLTPAQTPAEGAIVYITLPGATPLSTLTKQNGNWSVTISNARNRSDNQYISYDLENTNIDILVRNDSSEPTSVSTTTANDQPVSAIILGQSRTDVVSDTPTTGLLPESKFSLAPIVVTEPENDTTIAITFPARDGQKVSSGQPELKGVAPANSVVTITLQSNTIYTQTVIANSQGYWSWIPPGVLSNGDQAITTSYNDTDGILHTANRRFTIVSSASESIVGYQATPSASLSPTTKPSTTPTIRPTTKPTAIATNAPTRIPSSIPTAIPSLAPTVIPTVTPAELLPAGTFTPSFFIVILGSMFLTTGLFIAYGRR